MKRRYSVTLACTVVSIVSQEVEADSQDDAEAMVLAAAQSDDGGTLPWVRDTVEYDLVGSHRVDPE